MIPTIMTTLWASLNSKTFIFCNFRTRAYWMSNYKHGSLVYFLLLTVICLKVKKNTKLNHVVEYKIKIIENIGFFKSYGLLILEMHIIFTSIRLHESSVFDIYILPMICPRIKFDFLFPGILKSALLFLASNTLFRST